MGCLRSSYRLLRKFRTPGLQNNDSLPQKFKIHIGTLKGMCAHRDTYTPARHGCVALSSQNSRDRVRRITTSSRSASAT